MFEVPTQHSLVPLVELLTLSIRGLVLLAHHLHVRGSLRLHWRVEAVSLILLWLLIKLGHSIGLLSRLRASVVAGLLSGLLLVNLLLILIAAQLFLYIYDMSKTLLLLTLLLLI